MTIQNTIKNTGRHKKELPFLLSLGWFKIEKMAEKYRIKPTGIIELVAVKKNENEKSRKKYLLCAEEEAEAWEVHAFLQESGVDGKWCFLGRFDNRKKGERFLLDFKILFLLSSGVK